MRGLASAGELLDQGFRLYRRHAGALLRFTFAPSLAISLIIGLAIWYAAESNLGFSGMGMLAVGSLLPFPVLIFLSAGVLHGVAAAVVGQQMRARDMAWASLRRLVRTVVLAVIALPLPQILGIMAATWTSNVAWQVTRGIREFVYQTFDLPTIWPLLQAIRSWLEFTEGLSYYTSIVLAAQLPSALMLYLLQHDISRLPRPSRTSLAAAGRLLWTPVTAALLSGTLVFNILLLLGMLLARFISSAEATALGISAAGMIIFWTLSPLQPIWIALLYRRNRGAAQGEDLAERVRAWQARHTAAIDELQTEE
ncbi:MAG TPA: hypothetical protein VFS21_27880 [Roseiflexaceae bacterium]|nr:hypothetical protein [Roseiflexaceae bacterium]